MPLPARRMDANTSFLPSITLAGHGLQRGFDLDILHGHVARDLIGHQRCQLVEQAAKAVGAGLLLAHQRQLVLHQRVVDDVNVAHCCVSLFF
jgi:hypothetical protein